jgi:RNA polymerase sigma-70 factor (ECF subfamily)
MDRWIELQEQLPRYLAGDAQATRRLFEGIAAQLRPFFAARQGSAAAADDLTQATLLKIHFARDRYDPALPLKTWVFTIARRTLIDHLRGGAAALLQQLKGEEGGQPAEDREPASPALDPALRAELHDRMPVCGGGFFDGRDR